MKKAAPEGPSKVASWSVSKLKKYLKDRNVDVTNLLEKSELVAKVQELIGPEEEDTSSKGLTLSDAPLDLVTATAEDIAGHTVEPHIALHLRGNVPLMEKTFEVLREKEPLRANHIPTISMWITAIIDGDGRTGPLMSEILASQGNAVCGKHFKHGDIAFRCLDCAADPTCVMCAECFKTSPCQNHNYRMMRSGGGMCDCGDPTAWKPESFCDRHKGHSDSDDPTKSIPAEHRDWVFAVLRASLREVIRISHFECDLKKSASDNQLGALLGAISERFFALTTLGDCAKRVVALLLSEEYMSDLKIDDLPLDKPTCPLEQLILLDIADVRIREWDTVTKIVVQCLSDPALKTNFGKLLLRHMECLVQHQCRKTEESRFLQQGVQVFTVPTVADELMSSSKLGVNGGVTVVHRFLSSILHAMSMMSEKSDRKPKLSDRDFPHLFKIAEEGEKGHFHLNTAAYHLRYIFVASKLATAYTCASPALLRALCADMEVQHFSCCVYRHDSHKESTLSWDLELAETGTLWHMCNMFTTLADSIKDGTLDELLPKNFQFMLEQTGGKFPDTRFKYDEATGDDNDETSDVDAEFKATLSRCNVPEGESQTLVPPATTIEEYYTNLFRLVGEFLNSVSDVAQKELTQTRKLVAKSASQDGPVLRTYDLIHNQDAVSYNIPLVRLFGIITTSALDSKLLQTENPSQTLLNVFSKVEGGMQKFHDWCDMVIMIHVIRGQIRDQLWKRDHMGVLHHEGLYTGLHTSHFKELDLLFLQTMCSVVGPDALVYQLLQRFSYIPQKDRLNDKAAPTGFPRFLNLVLTMIGDNVKSSAERHDNHQLKLRTLRTLSQKAQLRSDVFQKIGRFDMDDDSNEGVRNEELNKVLAEVATVDRRKQGNFYRLKGDDNTWSKVSAYNINFDDNELMTAKKEYQSLQPRGTDGKLKNPNKHGYPRPAIAAHHPALDRSLRQMLHNDQVQAVAIYALVCRGNMLESLLEAKKQGGVPKTPQVNFQVSNSYLAKAVDTLYLACEDVRLSQGDVKAGNIDWNQYAFERENAAAMADRPAAFDDTSVSSPNPLPEIANNGRIDQNLKTPISQLRLHALEIRKIQKNSRAMTAVDALKIITENAPLEPDHDIIVRARAILVMIGEIEDEAGAEEVDPDAAKAAEEKQRKIKEKQKALMERMKKKQKQASTSLGLADKETKKAGAGDDAAATDAGIENNLQTKVVMATAEHECCFCQSSECSADDPMLQLAHVTTSSAIPSIYNENDGKSDRLGASVLSCGHVAHLSCIQRHHAYLEPMRRGDMRALIMSGRGFRGMFYISEREILCPMCGKICSGAYVIPQNDDMMDDKPAATSNQDSILSEWLSSAVYYESIRSEFLSICNEASVGFSRTNDAPALIDTDKFSSPLLHMGYNLVNIVSNNIRILIEKSKLGYSIPLREYSKLCALFVHVAAYLKTQEDEPDRLLEALSTSDPVLEEFDKYDGCDMFLAKVLCFLSKDDSLAWFDDLFKSSLAGVMAALPSATESDDDALNAGAASALSFFALVKAVLFGTPIPPPKPSIGSKKKVVTVDEDDIVFADEAEDRVEMLVKYLTGEATPIHELRDQLAAVATAPSTLHYIETATNKKSYVTRLTKEVLYLPDQFNEYVMALDGGEIICTKCNNTPDKPVVCIKSRKILCLKNKTKPELCEHVNQVGRGCGIFLLVKGTMPLVIQTVNNRATQSRSFYVDRYGETDEGLRRGVALQLDQDAVVEFLSLWVQCAFDHDTMGLQHTWKDNIDEL